jgi:hypothetical protein
VADGTAERRFDHIRRVVGQHGSVSTGSLLVKDNSLDYASGGASLWANPED